MQRETGELLQEELTKTLNAQSPKDFNVKDAEKLNLSILESVRSVDPKQSMPAPALKLKTQVNEEYARAKEKILRLKASVLQPYGKLAPGDLEHLKQTEAYIQKIELERKKEIDKRHPQDGVPLKSEVDYLWKIHTVSAAMKAYREDDIQDASKPPSH